MLRDNYAEDKVFAEILQLVPCMDPALAQVDVYLEDDELFQLIRADFSRRWNNLLRGETLEKFNRRVAELAVEHKVTKGRKLRTDGTVVESNIHPPSDSRQLADSVRVLERTVQRARSLSQAVQSVVQKTGRQITQRAG